MLSLQIIFIIRGDRDPDFSQIITWMPSIIWLFLYGTSITFDTRTTNFEGS